jgi:hypothetical protein
MFPSQKQYGALARDKYNERVGNNLLEHSFDSNDHRANPRLSDTFVSSSLSF